MAVKIQMGRLTVLCDTPAEAASLIQSLEADAIQLSAKSAKAQVIQDASGGMIPATLKDLKPKKVSTDGVVSDTSGRWPYPTGTSAATDEKAGTYHFLNQLGLNKTKTVGEFTAKQIAMAILRNREKTGKTYSYKTLPSGMIQITRTS